MIKNTNECLCPTVHHTLIRVHIEHLGHRAICETREREEKKGDR